MYKLELTFISHGQNVDYVITLSARSIKHLTALIRGLSSTYFNGFDIGVTLTKDNDLSKPFLCFVYDLNPKEFKFYLTKELRALNEF